MLLLLKNGEQSCLRCFSYDELLHSSGKIRQLSIMLGSSNPFFHLLASMFKSENGKLPYLSVFNVILKTDENIEDESC